MPGRIGQIGHHLNGFPPNSTRHHLNGFPPNLTNSTRHNLNGFPPNLTDSTRHHLNELGGSPLRLHCMPAWSNRSNWMEIHWDWAWSNRPGIWGRWCPIRPGIISMDFHPIWPIRQGIISMNWVVELVKLGGNPLRLYLVESVELDGNPLRWCLVKLGGNPSRWCPIWPIPPGINYWSNWVETHWDDDSNALLHWSNLTDSTRHHLNGFPPNLTGN